VEDDFTTKRINQASGMVSSIGGMEKAAKEYMTNGGILLTIYASSKRTRNSHTNPCTLQNHTNLKCAISDATKCLVCFGADRKEER
jgi:hypothetical protein